MSARRDLAASRLAIAGAFLMPCAMAIAHGTPTQEVRPDLATNDVQQVSVPSPEYPYLVKDPLSSRPGRLDSDTPLPGDAAAIDCSAPAALGAALTREDPSCAAPHARHRNVGRRHA